MIVGQKYIQYAIQPRAGREKGVRAIKAVVASICGRTRTRMASAAACGRGGKEAPLMLYHLLVAVL